MSSASNETERDLAAPIKRLAELDLSATVGDAATYEDTNTTYHHQLYNGPIVDPHVHFFDFERLSYPWLKGPHQIPEHPLLGNIDLLRKKSYLITDLEADASRHHVTKFVYVQAESEDNFKEAEYVESLISKHPSIAGIVAFADLTSPTATLDATLSRLSSFPHVKGVRQLVNYHPSRPRISNPTDLLSSPSFFPNYGLLSKYGLHFEFHGFANQLSQGVELAQRFPSIPMIINHSGLCVDHTEEGIDQWKANLTALAALPNTSIKISGLGMTDNHWTPESIRPFILDIIDVFGVDRCMFASNFPVEKVVGQYDEWYTAYKLIVANLTQEQQKKLFYENAIKFYRL